MKKSTRVDLVKVLKERNVDGKFDELIADAEAGEFHDYKNVKYDAPKLELHKQLGKFPELTDIREEVENGVYDEEADAEDLENLRLITPKSMWDMLGL